MTAGILTTTLVDFHAWGEKIYIIIFRDLYTHASNSIV